MLTFAASGWTYGEIDYESTFVLTDKGTESLWFPMTEDDCCVLVSISGVYADIRTQGIMRMDRTGWLDWQDRHPQTKFVYTSAPSVVP